MLTPLNRQLRVFVGVAALAWLFMVATGQFMFLAEGLIGLGMVCVIPLGAALAADADASDRARLPARIAAFGVPLGATLGLLGFALPPGATAAALAAAWLAGTLTLFAAGAARLLRRGALPVEELAIDVGHLYLPVGAVWLVASRAYLRRAGAPETPQDLAAHDCLHYLRPGDTPTWSFEPDPAVDAGTRRSVGVRGVFAANNSEALREAAIAGLGIALLPDFSAQAAVRSGKLQLVLPQWKPVGAFGEHLYAIRPYSPVVPRAVQAFIGYWRTALEDGFPIDK